MKIQENRSIENRTITILIAEDSRTQAEQLRFLLEQQGYRVRSAINGKDAFALAQTDRPDLIISDIIMPEMDGYQLCKTIKDDAELNDIPVILVTMLSDPQDIINGLECGADNFIRKPYDSDYLLTRVHYLLVNTELRTNQKIKMGMEVSLSGHTYFINAERQQIMDLLISTFEQAVHINAELKQRENDLAFSNQVLNGLYRLTEGLNQAVGEQEVVETALERTMEVLEAESGWIGLCENGTDFRIAASLNLPEELQTADAFAGDCECRHCLTQGEIDSARMIPCERLQRASDETAKLHLSVPLIIATRKLGIMNLLLPEDDALEEEKLEMVNNIGYQIAVALERAMLHQHLEQLVSERTAKLAAEIEQRKHIQAEQARLVAIIEATPDLVATMMPDSRIRYVNQAGINLLGCAQGSDLSGLMLKDRYPAINGNKLLEDCIPQAIKHGVWSGETTILNHEAKEIPFLQVIIAHKDSNGAIQYLSTIGRDITQLKAHEERILRLNRIHSVLSGINTTIVRVHERQELFDEACRIAVDLGLFQFAWIGLLDKKNNGIVPVAKRGKDGCLPDRIDLSTATNDTENCCPLTEAICKAKPIVCNDIASDSRFAHGKHNPPVNDFHSVAIFPLLLEKHPVGLLALYSSEIDVFDKEEMDLLTEMAGDISFSLDHLKKEESLNYLAYFNAVTGLPNRTLFLDRLNQVISIAHQEHENIAVIVLDIERFSSINESFGRQTGDELLRQFGRQLKTLLAETHILAHLSADYFAIAIRYKSHDPDINRLMNKISFDIKNHLFLICQQELRVSTRAGLAFYPGDGRDHEKLLRNAEAALKRSKQTGEKYLRYSPDINSLVVEKLTLENKLRRALEQEQFVLYYQPKIELMSGKISGLEALIRWQDPEAGLVPPDKFIPMLEETGMIIDVGLWALEKAIADSLAWKKKGLITPKVAVNVSPLQLHQPDFVKILEKTVNGYHTIELEITESLIMQDIEVNIQKLNTLRNMNIEIAVDDFGTGYSSLSYLTKLPVNALKIDRAFITNMTNNSDDMSVVSTIISLAHSLNMRVIAEGVEQDEQQNILRLLKCNEMQGYLFSPAVPAEHIVKLLQQS